MILQQTDRSSGPCITNNHRFLACESDARKRERATDTSDKMLFVSSEQHDHMRG